MMSIAVATVVILLLVNTVHCQSKSYNVTINSNISDPSCYLSPSAPITCVSLMQALQLQLQAQPGDYVYFYLSAECHFVNNNGSVLYFHDYYVTFIGNSGTEIVCSENAGFYFYRMNRVNLQNLAISNCSAKRNGTYRNPWTELSDTFMVSLYYMSSRSVQMTNVVICTSPGVTAVVLYNTYNATIKSSKFLGTKLDDSDSTFNSSGGFLVELTYCQEGIECDDTQQNSINNAAFTFDGCQFSYNTASNMVQANDMVSNIVNGLYYSSLGRGGGLSILVKGACHDNSFKITNSSFTNNTANHGGGIFVGFLDSTYQNTITIGNSQIVSNFCPLDPLKEGVLWSYSGGGINIESWIGHLVGTAPNQVILSGKLNVENNTAYVGGGIFLHTKNSNSPNNLVKVSDSIFQGNGARFGSAFYSSSTHKVAGQAFMSLEVNNCFFHNNKVRYAQKYGQTGCGAIYSYLNDINFSEEIVFRKNTGSALVMVHAFANFTGQSNVTFDNNNGMRGGAVSLLGSAYINVNTGTTMLFQNNIATYQGGAVYKSYSEQVSPTPYSSCFIQHQNATLNPDQWGVTLTFSGNYVSNGKHSNSIHAMSIAPCRVKGKAGGSPLCWKGWFYNKNNETCNSTKNHVTTDFNQVNRLADMTAIPGRKFTFQLNLTDELGQSISSDGVQSFIVEKRVKNSSKFKVLNKAPITIEGNVSDKVCLIMESLEKPSLHLDVTITLESCPPGFFNLKNGCFCLNDNEYGGFINCTDGDRNLAVLLDHGWIGIIENNTYVGICPMFYCLTKVNGIELPPSQDFSDLIICDGNRTGVLCGQCIDGFSQAVNSWRLNCVQCNESDHVTNVLKYCAAVYIPYFIMMFTIIFFNFRLASGPASTLVMYFQMVTTTFDASIHGLVEVYPEKALDAYRYIYGPLNLDFIEMSIEDICLPFINNTISSLMIAYMLVIIPMVIILTIAVCILLSRKFKLNIKLRNWTYLKDHNVFKHSPKSPGDALTLAVTTVISLSFIKICIASALVLNTTHLININGSNTPGAVVSFAAHLKIDSPEYRLYMIPAVTSEILVIIFILLMLDFPLRFMEFIIHRVAILNRIYPERAIHSFAAAFNTHYKYRFRIFAGLNFLLRYLFSLVFVSLSTQYTKFTLQSLSCSVMILLIFFCWPYKVGLHNYIDILILTNLVILNGLGYYQYVSFFLSHSKGTKNSGTNTIFAIQYVFILTPLICIILYVIFKLTESRHKGLLSHIQHTLSGLLMKWSSNLHKKVFTSNYDDNTKFDEARNEIEYMSIEPASRCQKKKSQKESHPLILDSESDVETDHNQSAVPVTIIGVFDKGEGEASTYQTSQSEGYFLRSDWDSAQIHYGSIKDTSKGHKKHENDTEGK